MARANAQIRLTGQGRDTLALDGAPLPAIRALTLHAEAGQVARLTVDLLLHEVDLAGEVAVTVPEATRQALLALGWTPPDDSDGADPR